MKVKINPEYDAFTRAMDHILSIPREELLRREAEYKKRSLENPRRRGPKRKVVKPSVSPGPGD